MRIFVALYAFAQLAITAHTQEIDALPRVAGGALDEAKEAVYHRSNLSVALVERTTPLGKDLASGFFLSAPGRMLTVLPATDDAGEGEIKVTCRGDVERELNAKVLASDPYTGLALLEVEGADDAPALTLGKSVGLKPGSYVYAVGGTADKGAACAVGRIAGRDKGIEGKSLATSVLRLNTEGLAAATGAPLLDGQSRLVGVVLLAEKSGAGYALPAEVVGKLLRDFEKHGAYSPSWIGFGMEMGTTTPEIRSVSKGGPAAAAMLQAGDVILAIDGRPVSDYQDVIDACYALTPSVGAKFEILRGLDDVEVELVPVKRDKR